MQHGGEGGLQHKVRTVLHRTASLSPTPLKSWLQAPRAGAAGTAGPILLKNKQEPRSTASPDPPGSRPSGLGAWWCVWGGGTSPAPGPGLGPFSTPTPALLLHPQRA